MITYIYIHPFICVLRYKDISVLVIRTCRKQGNFITIASQAYITHLKDKEK
jgi:hypothetical protein